MSCFALRRRAEAAVCAFLLCAAFQVAAAAVPASALYFASDAAGFQGGPVSGPADSEYVLALFSEGGTETRVLYRKAEEIERRIIAVRPLGRLERIFRQGTLAEEDEYGESGEILSEKLYMLKSKEGPVLSERRVYSYRRLEEGQNSRQLLQQVEAFDGSGKSTGTMLYQYDARGRLSQAAATGSLGAEKAGASVGPSGLAAGWTEIGGKLFIAAYAQGRPSVESVLDSGGRLLESLSYSYDGSGLLLSTLKFEEASGLSTQTDYGPKGKPVSETVRLGSEIRSLKSWKYDEKSRLTEEESRNGDISTLRLVSYSESGAETESTRISRAGLLVSIETINPDKSSIKELYDKGILFVRIYSQNGKKVKEEFIKDGRISRVRIY